jgi:DNA-directed RNA polymerase specialized sigma24 family protein
LRLDAVLLDDADLRRVEERALDGRAGLVASLEALPAATSAALLARVVDERSYGEIAAELGCSEQVVRQRVHRGLTALRAGLEEE